MDNNQPNLVPPTPTQENNGLNQQHAQPPKPKSRHWIIYTILALIIVVLVAALIYLLFFNKKDSENKQTTNTNSATSGETGPSSHVVLSASSKDGLNFTADDSVDKPLVSKASVPAIVRKGGEEVIVYYVDGSTVPEKLGCVKSTNSAKSFSAAECKINNLSAERAVDYSVLQAPDGQWRMYYYGVKGQIDSDTDHTIYMATSSDAQNFTEAMSSFTYKGLVDPDVYIAGDNKYVMNVMSLQSGTVVATSTDGKTFTYKDKLSPTGVGVTQPVKLKDGTYRMYGFIQGEQNAFYSYKSKDGYSWTKEDGTRLSAPEGYEITDPSVVILNDGTFKMVYKASAAKQKGTTPKTN